MTGQQQIADQGAPAASGPCAWCGENTTLRLQIRRGSGKAAKALKMTFEVWCCAAHQRSLQLRGDS